MMYTSLQVVVVSALALIFLRYDVGNMNHDETQLFFCHGFTATTAPAIHQDRFRHRKTSAVNMVSSQPKSSSSIIKNDMLYHSSHNNDVDVPMDTTIIATTITTSSRRYMMTQAVKSVMAMTTASILHSSITSPALASGGATAGRYTTIPIAKRRYYGRVQQAVHEFLEMGAFIVKGEMSNPIISTFFDVNGVVVVEAKRKDVNGQCTKKDNECKGREIRDSRWNDMKASMYLLGNAFRTDQQKPPDRLPTVKAARAFFKEMNEIEKIVKSTNSKKMTAANTEIIQKLYTNALLILDIYLDLVELPPTNSGHYDQEFDTLVGETARIT